MTTEYPANAASRPPKREYHRNPSVSDTEVTAVMMPSHSSDRPKRFHTVHECRRQELPVSQGRILNRFVEFRRKIALPFVIFHEECAPGGYAVGVSLAVSAPMAKRSPCARQACAGMRRESAIFAMRTPAEDPRELDMQADGLKGQGRRQRRAHRRRKRPHQRRRVTPLMIFRGDGRFRNLRQT